jgi:hypothetical protein
MVERNVFFANGYKNGRFFAGNRVVAAALFSEIFDSADRRARGVESTGPGVRERRRGAAFGIGLRRREIKIEPKYADERFFDFFAGIFAGEGAGARAKNRRNRGRNFP